MQTQDTAATAREATTAGPSDAGLFARLADLTGYTRRLAIARPEDIIRQEEAEEDGGAPRTKFHLRPGAETTMVEIRALTDAERERCERIMQAAVPKPVFKDEFGPDGKLRSRTPAGYDDEAPEYLAARAAARSLQVAHVCIFGCLDLKRSTPGDTVEDKARVLRERVDGTLLEFIAGNVWNLGYTGSDAASFFSTAASADSPS